MLEFIHIKNFKTLLKASFPLAKMNLFSGLNGMGKSSLIQVLLLLRQSYERNVLLDKGLLLNGDYVSLGTGKDVLSIASEDDDIQITVRWSDKDPAHFVYDYKADSDLIPNNQTPELDNPDDESLFNSNFKYLSADRLSPTSHHQLSDYHIRELNSLGNKGEYTVHYIAENGSKKLQVESLKHPKATAETLLSNIEAWMSDITPGLKVQAVAQPKFNTATLSYSFVQGTDKTDEFKPQNVGFGLSYVLPVVTSILSAAKDDLLIIENPESHLHPAGQAIMGKLCAIAAENGVQLIVESHSDHFLNGVRVAVKEGLVDCETVKIFFLQRNMQSDTHESEVLYPNIDSQGRIDMWPEGFFDEWDNQLDRLL
ncbi:AAA family ATPase [Maridesulfovibrio sp.]|uniref:AAA family ATPase n=1 Tax=unclassified Maridesulfovibrio TaxID=2794999 RepID=UPI003AFF6A5B